MQEAIAMAKEGIESGKASVHLEKMAKISQQLAS
jgi:anthranilate phosphoribosyltransferase